jgi:hypothetical protein
MRYSPIVFDKHFVNGLALRSCAVAASRTEIAMRLYDYGPSQNCFKVRLLAAHLGLALEIVPVSIFKGEGASPEFLAKNPMGTVPLLETDSGECLPESNAILAFLAEDTPYLPGRGMARARVMRWLMFEQRYIQTSVSRLRYWTLTGKLAISSCKTFRLLGCLEIGRSTFWTVSSARHRSSRAIPTRSRIFPFLLTAMLPPTQNLIFPKGRILQNGLIG